MIVAFRHDTKSVRKIQIYFYLIDEGPQYISLHRSWDMFLGRNEKPGQGVPYGTSAYMLSRSIGMSESLLIIEFKIT